MTSSPPAPAGAAGAGEGVGPSVRARSARNPAEFASETVGGVGDEAPPSSDGPVRARSPPCGTGMRGGWKEATASYMWTPGVAARAKAVAAAAEVSVSSTSTAIVVTSRWKPMTVKVPPEEGTLASTRLNKESSEAFPARGSSG